MRGGSEPKRAASVAKTRAEGEGGNFLEKMEKGVDASADGAYIVFFGWSGQVKSGID